jgi:hypothetical protein
LWIFWVDVDASVEGSMRTPKIHSFARPAEINPVGSDRATARRPELGYPLPNYLVELRLVHRRSSPTRKRRDLW